MEKCVGHSLKLLGIV